MPLSAYKLVDSDGYTRRGQSGETLWLPVGTVVSPTGEGTADCGPGVLHAYVSPEVAILANPIHADIAEPRLLRVKFVGLGSWQTDGLKRWTTARLRTVEELPLPALTIDERIAWAILLAPHPTTRAWAVRWLSGEDRTAAWAAAAAAAKAAAAAAWAAAAAEAKAAVDKRAFESRLMPALARARAILAGTYPAEQFDAPWETVP